MDLRTYDEIRYEVLRDRLQYFNFDRKAAGKSLGFSAARLSSMISQLRNKGYKIKTMTDYNKRFGRRILGTR